MKGKRELDESGSKEITPADRVRALHAKRGQDDSGTKVIAPADRLEKQTFFRTPGRAAMAGAILAIPALFVLVAVCALTVGIPVPMVGWVRGVDVALQTPMLLYFLTVLSAGLVPIIAVAVGAWIGSAVWHSRSGQRQRTDKKP